MECELGTYSTASSATSKDTCTLCSAVSSSKDGPGSSTCVCNAGYSGPDLGPCDPCSAGTYKDALGSEPCDNLCPAHSISPAGSDAITDCQCNAGYSGADGQVCTACPAGKFKEAVGSEECTSCQDNSGSLVVGSITASDCVCNKGFTGTNCIACDSGTYKPITGSGACIVCASGKYSSASGAIASTTCQPCPDATTSPASSSAVTNCVCNAGFLGPAGGPCVICTSGKYQQGTECVDCPDGQTSAPGSTSAADCQDLCQAGSYGPHGGPCILCEEAKYKPTPGSEPCDLLCPPNTQSPKGSKKLTDCICIAVACRAYMSDSCDTYHSFDIHAHPGWYTRILIHACKHRVQWGRD